MSLTVLILALAGGVGLWVLTLAFVLRRRASDEDSSTAGAGARYSLQATSRMAMGKVEEELQGRSALMQDCRMVGRTVQSHALIKITGLVVGAALLGGGGGFLVGVLGVDIPAAMLVALAALGGLLGWWLPDSMLRTEAEKERRLFQQVTESWLELAGQLVTAGSDTFAALVTAASYSDQPVFTALADALRVSAARGEPPWTGLRRLSDERRLRFLDPFCAALELAGTTGAGSRETILSQVDSARSKAMHEADARAASAGEKMGAPLALIGGAFMLLMGYPPMAGIMDTATISGPGL